jgi:hypothetical protein
VGIQGVLGRGRLRGQRHRTFYRDALREFADVERHGDVGGLGHGNLDPRSSAGHKTRGRSFNGVRPLGKTVDREFAFDIGDRALEAAAGFVPNRNDGLGNCFVGDVGDDAGDRSGTLGMKSE